MDALHTLVTLAQSGDLDAFGDIVKRFQGMAYASAYAMLDDMHLAEDVAQNAFIEAYLNLPKLREPSAFPGWFRRIIFKQGDRMLRGKHLTTIPLESTTCDIPLADLNPAVIIEGSERDRLVSSAIEGLPESERIVTLLFYITGYSLKDIAAFLEVPVTTVKKRLFDARKRLKARLMESVRDTLHEQRPSYLSENRFPDTVRILIAIRTGDAATVKAMLTRDPTLVNARARYTERIMHSHIWAIGHVPLYEAAIHDNKELVNLLLEYGADINARTSSGETALHGAVALNCHEMVSLLLDKGADINAAIANGQTPLRLAVIKGHQSIVELFLKRGAQVNTKGNTGLTPLHWAALKGYEGILILLLEAGAKINAQDELGRTPLDWAIVRGQTAISNRLRP